MSRINLISLSHLTESEKIVITALLEEAEYKIREKVKKGKDKNEAIKEVSDDMNLDGNEQDALQTIFDNPTAAVATEENPYPNSIYFEDPADITSAIGVLMYSNIPWESKSANTENPYIQFADQNSLKKAMDVLNRKWDFINNQRDNVATISFDNISDYKKVMDFINKNGMFINFDDNSELDEDIAQVEKEKVIDHNGRSFKAANKKLKEKIDPIKNKNQRSLVVRRRQH